jgi:hypothetical protein
MAAPSEAMAPIPKQKAARMAKTVIAVARPEAET